MSAGQGPKRTCLGCRKTFPQKELLRFVLSPENQVLIDYRGCLPGRGAYTCQNLGCLRQAVKNKGFNRTFRQPGIVLTADQLINRYATEIRGKIFNLMGMIRKSGLGIVGSNPVLHQLQSANPPACLILAEDAAPGTEKKLYDRTRAIQTPVLRFGTRAELGKIWGRDVISTVGLKPHPLTNRFEAEINRFRTVTEGN